MLSAACTASTCSLLPVVSYTVDPPILSSDTLSALQHSSNWVGRLWTLVELIRVWPGIFAMSLIQLYPAG